MKNYANKGRKPGKKIPPKKETLPSRHARATVTEKEPVEGALSARARNNYAKNRPAEETGGIMGSLMRFLRG